MFAPFVFKSAFVLALAPPAETRPLPAEERPVLVFLKVAVGSSAQAREEAIQVELSLLIERFRVVSVTVSAAILTAKPLADQVRGGELLGGADDAVAVAWLTEEDGQPMLHVVARETGRLLTAPIDPGPGRRAILAAAMTIREMLAAADLYEPESTPAPPAADVVAGVEREPSTVEPKSTTALGGFIAGSGASGLVGQRGSATALGFELGGELGVARHLTFRASLEARAREPQAATGKLKAWTLAPRASAWWLTAMAPWVVGAGLSLGYARESISLRVGDGPSYALVNHRLLATAEGSVRLYVSSTVALALGCRLEWATPQHYVTRRSDGATIWASPMVALGTTLGMILRPLSSY